VSEEDHRAVAATMWTAPPDWKCRYDQPAESWLAKTVKNNVNWNFKFMLPGGKQMTASIELN